MKKFPDPYKLKPCPFCGGKARWDGSDMSLLWVECGGCGLKTRYLKSAVLLDIVDLWNRRVDPVLADIAKENLP
jgi:Lar family restriction alleviation protein